MPAPWLYRHLWAVLAGGMLVGVLVTVAIVLMGLEPDLAGILMRRVLMGVAAACVLLVPLSLLLTRRLTAPLRRLADGSRRIVAGDQNVSLPIGAGGHLGQIARAVRQLDHDARANTEKLRLDRNRLATVLSFMVEGVVAVDSEDRIVHMNAAAARILRSSSGDMTGQPVWELTRVRAISQVLAQARESATPVAREATVQEGAQEQTLQLKAAPLSFADGELDGAVVVLHDISEQQRLEATRREFVANVSHELKTPLTAIAALVETLLDDEDVDLHTRRRFLSKIQDQGVRLTAMVGDLLDLSRIESGGIQAEFQQLDLRPTLSQVVGSLQLEADRRGVQVNVSLPDHPLILSGDERSLGRMLGNLVENAIRYTTAGGVVQVQADLVEAEIQVKVQDDGMGIEEVHQGRIFERFYRVDKGRAREAGGTGLGLSIVKHVVMAHHGSVSLRSSPGEGSTFLVTLPPVSAALE
jgi:two-component system phosphate regulon sensor histidine kinase PhoR